MASSRNKKETDPNTRTGNGEVEQTEAADQMQNLPRQEMGAQPKSTDVDQLTAMFEALAPE